MHRSRDLHARALQRIPGGVNSPVRAFHAVGGDPLYIASGRGNRVTDVDGRSYIDGVGSWGPLILGHAHPRVIEAIARVAATGTTFGAPTELEVRLAETIARLMPAVAKVRLVSSGTEAAMSAIRLARAFTGRDKIVKFEGCYHGHADSFLVKAGSGAATFGQPSSPGVPAALAAETLNAPYNDLAAVQRLFEAWPQAIAGVIVEPVAGNMGVALPEPGFLAGLRQLTTAHGALLVFDEVITGFRLGLGGAQAHYGVVPDLTVLGKIIGGGLPVGAFGGRAEIMDRLAPLGPVYQAGTLSGNPLAVAAGLATLEVLEAEPPYAGLATRMDRLGAGLRQAAAAAGVDVCVNAVASMGTLFFQPGPVRSWDDAARSDTRRYARFHRHMLEAGVYLAPSQYEALFLSAAHTDDDVDRIVAAAAAAFAALAQ
jgi:glutamate-1-semialdehyde 2,1-aminomutase